MASNPIQRRARQSFLVGFLIALIIMAVVVVFLFMRISSLNEENTTLQTAQTSRTKSVYTLNTDVKSGETITLDILTYTQIISDLDVYGIAHDPRTIIDPQRNSLLQRFYYDAKNYPLILMGGTRSTEEGGGNHVWVIDGFTTDKMVHANMGWNGEENGWFKISNTLHFETAIGDYSTNFWTISKLRKK